LRYAPATGTYGTFFQSGNIKRVIIFSSTVSVGISRTDPEYTEEDWNDLAVDDVKANGKAASGFMKYSASKTLAERGAMTFTKSRLLPAYAWNHISCLGALPRK